MRYLVGAFFKDNKGEWHQPGTVIDMEPEEAALWKSRGVIKAYRTQMVTQPETRVVEIPKRRGRNAGG